MCWLVKLGESYYILIYTHFCFPPLIFVFSCTFASETSSFCYGVDRVRVIIILGFYPPLLSKNILSILLEKKGRVDIIIYFCPISYDKFFICMYVCMYVQKYVSFVRMTTWIVCHFPASDANHIFFFSSSDTSRWRALY